MLWAVCSFFMLLSKPALAQENEELASKLPDDSLLIAEQVVDSVPEKFDVEKKYKVVEAYFKQRKLRFEEYKEGEGKVFIAYPTEVGKDLKFYDRKIEMTFLCYFDNSQQIIVRAYASEKMLSKGKGWRIMEKRSKDRVVGYQTAFTRDLKKRFRTKVVTFGNQTGRPSEDTESTKEAEAHAE